MSLCRLDRHFIPRIGVPHDPHPGVAGQHPVQALRRFRRSIRHDHLPGVLGLNGSGKSTLLRIMAGADTEYSGEVSLSKGYSVGMLEQEPQLDPDKTVK